jgi:tellurite resistance protein TerC
LAVLGFIEITLWHWGGFVAAILLFLAVDLGVFHKSAHVVKVKEALLWTGLWFSLAMLFAWGMVPLLGHEEALEFTTGYLIELSLSMDNVFAIALIFAYFRIPNALQHRVLFWGIIGALVMRGLMIGVGAALIQKFHFILYVFGAFLIYTGVKMAVAKEEGVHPEKNNIIRLAKKFFPVSEKLEGQKFFTLIDGRKTLTPLAMVLLMVETTDLVFALDSIPAIFAVTQKAFIVFTSNVFAILGLRSLYFVLAGAIAYFRYLKAGLSIVLVFIGAKMLIAWKYKIDTGFSLGVVGVIILLAMIASVISGRRDQAVPKTRS